MIVLVPEIHFVNFPLFWIISFFVKVRTCRIYSYLQRFKGRIEIIELSDYASWEQCELIKDHAVEHWQKFLPSFPTQGWHLRIGGTQVDMVVKAKQDVQREIERFLFFRHIAGMEHAKIVYSLKALFLSRLDKNSSVFIFPSPVFFSYINIGCDVLNSLLVNGILFLQLLTQYIKAWVSNAAINKHISVIYDGISPREISISKDKITFNWLCDENMLHKKEFLYIIPKADFQMKQYEGECRKDKEINAVERKDFLRCASRMSLERSFSELLKIFFRCRWWSFMLRDLMLVGYYVQIYQWVPLVQTISPHVYIGSSSSFGQEDPVLAYFHAQSIRTVAWFYGTNSYLFSTHKPCSFKNIVLSNILSQKVIVWNQHFADFLWEHPQNNVEVIVIGPLMCGDEDVLQASRESLLQDKVKKSGCRYIAMFDSPPAARAYRGNTLWIPDSNTEEYNFSFIRDLYAILKELPSVILVYKPKRSLTSGKFAYTPRLEEIFETMIRDDRVLILDYNINPWVPIALADVCISMPFESPTIAALHYEKAAFFYDPLKILEYHRYQKFPELILRGYEELINGVSFVLSNNLSRANLFEHTKARSLQGFLPQGNSSNRMRELLKNYTY